MRLLPERPDHAGRGAAQAKTEAYGSRHRRHYAGQHLPLRNLSTHSSGDQAGCGGEGMNAVHIVSRRGLLERFVSAGALVLGAPLVPQLLSAGEADQAPFHPSVYLGIEPDGTVVIVTHRSEMGTGIRSVLPVIAAEELDANWKRVKIEQAIGDQKYGSQNTDGSCSIRDFYTAFRQAGATARTMLERAAAAKWQAPVGECHAQLHEIIHQPSGRKLGFGELVASAAQQPLPKKEEL